MRYMISPPSHVIFSYRGSVETIGLSEDIKADTSDPKLVDVG